MANKFRDLFSGEVKPNVLQFQLEDAECNEKFQATISEVFTTGKMQEVKGIKEVVRLIEENDRLYPVEKTPVTVSVIGPAKEVVNWPLRSEEYVGEMQFYRTYLKNRVILETTEEAIVKFVIKMERDAPKIIFTQSMEMGNAHSLIDLIDAFKQAKMFVSTLFMKNISIPERDKMLFLFTKGQHYFEQLQELEKEINVQFDIELIKKDEKAYVLGEELYLMLVKNEKIKRNHSINFLTTNSREIYDIGQEVFVSDNSKQSYKLYGKEIIVYEVRCFFNSVISSIEQIEDNMSKIYFSSSESKPAYSVHSGYVLESDAIKESESIGNKIEVYQNAKPIWEHLKEL